MEKVSGRLEVLTILDVLLESLPDISANKEEDMSIIKGTDRLIAGYKPILGINTGYTRRLGFS